MKKTEQLAKLKRITSAELQIANLGMAKLRQEEESLRAQLKALRLSQDARVSANLIEADASLIAGADVKWLAWIEARSTFLNQELLTSIVAQDKFLGTVKRAFGRAEAVKSLAAKEDMNQKYLVQKRTDYTS